MDSDYGYDSALGAFDVSLTKLGLDYLDLYLLHWPLPTDFDAVVASYKAAEKLLDDARVRAIDVCNHSPQHLQQLIDRTNVVPAVNQVELHPLFTQRSIREADASHGIVTQSWSPLGGVNSYRSSPPAERNLLQQPVITQLAGKYGKTAAQIVLRWHVQHGLCAIPKSARPQRIAENIGVFDFTLTDSDIAAIDDLDTGVRGGPNPDEVDASSFKLTIDD